MINFMHSYGQVRHVRAGISWAHHRIRATRELLTDAGRSAGEPIPVAIEMWR